MSGCSGCTHLGGKVGHWRRCHKLPEALSPRTAQKYQRFPEKYHCAEHPCPDFAPKAQ